MRVVVDQDRCSGHARCAAMGPDLFVLDATGYNRMNPTDVPVALAEQARRAADACPERAITLISDDQPE